MIAFIRRSIIILAVLLMVINPDYSAATHETLQEEEQRIEKYLLSSSDYTNVKYYADKYSYTYDIPTPILYKLLETESGWGLINPDKYIASVEGDGGESFGPAQIQMRTARRYRKGQTITRKKLLYNIKFNIETACIILSKERDHFARVEDDESVVWLHALSSYNMGRYGFNKRMKPNDYAKNIVLAYNS